MYILCQHIDELITRAEDKRRTKYSVVKSAVYNMFFGKIFGLMILCFCMWFHPQRTHMDEPLHPFFCCRIHNVLRTLTMDFLKSYSSSRDLSDDSYQMDDRITPL